VRPDQLSRQYLHDFMKSEMERYTTLIKKIGIEPQ